MLRSLEIAICLLLFSSVCAQDRIQPADYYPILIGAEWEYEDTGTTATEIVTGIEEGLFVLEDADGVKTYLSSDTEGMRLHRFYVPDQDPDLEWSYFDPPLTRYPYEMELGVEYESRSLLVFEGLWDVETFLSYKATFQGFEDHTVGDRTYPLCAKMTIRDASRSVFLEETIMTTVTDTTEWLAWGVGAVEKQSHITSWNILNGNSEEWIELRLIRCSFLEENVPILSFTSPSAVPAYMTEASSVFIAGDASDDSRLMRVTWEDDKGNNGLATLNGGWEIGDVALEWGKAAFTLCAWDSCGNVATEVLTIYRMTINEPPHNCCHESEMLGVVQLSGQGLVEDLVVELTCDDKTFCATNCQILEGGTVLQFDIDLKNSGAGMWDMVIRDPSQAELVRFANCVETASFRITEMREADVPAVFLSWTSLPDRNYEVWSAADLGGQWEIVGTVPSQGSNTNTQVSPAALSTCCFFKILALP
jgi:hypothetical protein